MAEEEMVNCIVGVVVIRVVSCLSLRRVHFDFVYRCRDASRSSCARTYELSYAVVTVFLLTF